jgi:hypothetical protein
LPHPYEYELQNLQYLPYQLERTQEQIFLPIENNTPQWISTQKELKEIILDLKNQKEIAVDVEHHSYRSYLGLIFFFLIHFSYPRIYPCDLMITLITSVISFKKVSNQL